MRIKTKLLVASIVMIVVLIALAGAGINNINIQSRELHTLNDNRYQKMLLAFEVRGEVNEIAKGISNLLTDPTPETVEANLPIIEDAAQRAVASFETMEEQAELALERQLLSDVTSAGEAYVEYAEQVITLVSAGDAEAAIDLRASRGLGVQDALVQRANDLAEYHRHAMDDAFEESIRSNRSTFTLMNVVTGIGLLAAIGALLWNMWNLNVGLQSLSTMIRGFASGTVDSTTRIRNIRKDEFGDVAKVFNSLAEDLEARVQREEAYNRQVADESWVKSNLAQVSLTIQSDTELASVSREFIRAITPLVGAHYGVLYVREGFGEQQFLKAQGAFAFEDESIFEKLYVFGQGLVGECAQDGKIIQTDQLPEDYVKVRTGLGSTPPRHLVLIPVHDQQQVLGVIELASLRPFTELEQRLLAETAESLGVIVNNLFGRLKVEELLRESQAMGEELQTQSEELTTQQEELRRSNEKLEEQTKQLKKSEELLQSQQEELEQTNEELLQKTHMLELQMKQTEQKNEQIEKTKATLEKQTVQLAMSSKYKSEFLTNMSHELRTPLNSLLILSQMLSDNKDGNLTSKQVEYATTIHSSGSDLLKLIDEILDISKISAGKMDVVVEHVPIEELDLYFRRNFSPVSLQKNVAFETKVEAGVPEEMYTDSHRVKQIIKNLLSNAFKFTSSGSVQFTIRTAEQEEHGLDGDNETMIAFEVKDTGIGIPEDKQQLIFEAFQQVDGTTSRVYGGTGLGLAISRELAGLLGGTIRLHSEEGKGSTFTLYLPEFHVAGENNSRELHDDVLAQREEEREDGGAPQAVERQAAPAREPAAAAASERMSVLQTEIEDDSERIEPSDKVVLIVEDDVNFAKVLLDIAHSRGFKGIVALQGDKGLAYARTYKPDAILLDIQLPVIDGWTVLNQLKHHSDTRHIPVHVISVVDDIQHGLAMGAIAYLKKPTDKRSLEQVFTQIESFLERDLKRLLVVEDDTAQRNSIVELIGHDDVLITGVSTGAEALAELQQHHFDCMVLDLGLPDISGFELLDAIRGDESMHDLPIIIYTGRELEYKEELKLKKYAGTIIIKDVKSPERLLDETTLFLHRVEADLPEEKRSMLRKLHNIETIFEGKDILIVDDDIRNVFALSSVLESYHMNITFAENGREALEQLDKQPGIDLVLMDIMMPEMDGYETMREIRKQSKYDKLPIIAVTAKAMKDDRDKCIDAGASDYIAKPVNTEQLLSLMRVWLYK
ncbi:response regulator [Paenibacillus sp. IB182496]|uniref:Circadian input-output histidine kinase CikA n=1 Tax=Paenibacillus sabuli TaxID=2772509 RepID=A0A927BQA1_9BACL|nr:response regulator [Paenibacillus sabuli]MBD2843715.1 response regulator [Paenibacillus sabuli]